MSGHPVPRLFIMGLKMTNVQLVLNWGGKWKSHHGQYWYEGRRAKKFDFPRDANYDQLSDSMFLVASYSAEIHPVGQPSEWLVPSDIASKIVHPPVGRRPPGRPRKNRLPSFGEEVTQRRCTTCHCVGHNSHTCTYPKSSTPLNGMGSTSEIGEASGSHNVL
ncbi:hypothetical protein Dsin_028297 [Dipteronia sinensis]|uniref:Uncharacterized protein n=1 Tax=Dipteronia sinensis TaxID=43782 RepID=A0AAD9ZRY0_9ROSI|nr:hypothetical protein Dsin_028297 [Dipteronia sinensis]